VTWARWEAEALTELAAPASVIWELWADPQRWGDWNPAIVTSCIDGPFAAGSRARIRFRGRPAMRFVITAVEPERRFVDETRLPGARMGHEHRIDAAARVTLVRHRIYFDGPLASVWGRLMGRRIRRDLQTFLRNEARLVRAAA
jgi:hypothetical protein